VKNGDVVHGSAGPDVRTMRTDSTFMLARRDENA